MLLRTQTIADLGSPFNDVTDSNNNLQRISLPLPREESTFLAGNSQPAPTSTPITPPRFSNSQPVPGRQTRSRVIYHHREPGRPPIPHHIIERFESNNPEYPQPPPYPPLRFDTLRLGGGDSLPRRTPSPLYPVPSFVLRPPVEPKGTFVTEGGEPIARDFAYEDRNPDRPKDPPKEGDDKQEESFVIDPVKHLQNNKFWNPSGRPIPSLDKHGLILNGEDVFKWDYRPYVGLPQSPSNNEDLVPTPIVTPNGSYIYPNGEQNEGNDEENEGGRLNTAHLELSRALEKLAEEQEQLRLNESGAPVPPSWIGLHPAFGSGSPLTSNASSSIPSIDESVTEDQQTVASVDGLPCAGSPPNNENGTHSRYSLRNRSVIPSQMQSGRPSASRNSRSRNVTPTLPSPNTRAKENAGDTPPGPAPEHPHHPSRRSVSTKAQTRSTLKRQLEDEGSSTSLQSTPITAVTVTTSTLHRNDDFNEESTQHMTRSRARKVRKVARED